MSLPLVAEKYAYSSGTSIRWTRAMRGPLSTRNSSIRMELHSPMSTREPLSGPLMCPLTPVCTRCASRHSLSLRLSATSQLALFSSGPFRPNTRGVCQSRSCGTHHTMMLTCRVGLCTRRAVVVARVLSLDCCRALESRAPLCCCHPRGTARRAPNYSSFQQYRDISHRRLP